MSDADYVMSPQEQAIAAHKRAEAAELHAHALAQELLLERAKTPDQRLAEAAALIAVLKVIGDTSVANLHPEFIVDLPAEAYEVAAKLLPTSIGSTQRDAERAEVWAERAELIKAWRARRATPEWQAHKAAYEERQREAAAPAAKSTLRDATKTILEVLSSFTKR